MLRRLLITALVALWPLSSHAGVYVLIDGVTATQTSPKTSLIVSPQSSVNGGPVQNAAFVVWGTGIDPSCTVQFLGSNDGGVTWVNIGSTVVANSTVAGGPNVSATTTTTASYQTFGAIVTAISGTGTKCFANMSG